MGGEFDVVVVGGGIIGALSSYELAKNGAKVLLVEKNRFGFGASGNSAAMLELQLDAHRGEPFYSLGRKSHDLFPSLAEELLEKTGIDFHFTRCSILQIALKPNEVEPLKSECGRQSKIGHKIEWLSPETIASRWPQIKAANFGGALFGDDGQVNGTLFLKASLQAARKAGVTIREQDSTFSLKKMLAQGLKVVVAAGAWTDEILSEIGVRLGITPVRGQLVVFDTPAPVLPFPIYTITGGYITPKQDGTTLAGTTVENAGFDSSTTEQGKKSIIELAKSIMPTLLDRPIKTVTAGLRPKSPDDLPLIGPLPEQPNVFIAAGHYRNGVLLAPITAKIVSAWALNKKPPLDIHPFSPSRLFSKA